jgi:hypothetical protein
VRRNGLAWQRGVQIPSPAALNRCGSKRSSHTAKIAQDPLEAAVRELARPQAGHLERRQLLSLGLGAGAIKARLHNGSLVVRHTGVYAIARPGPTHPLWPPPPYWPADRTPPSATGRPLSCGGWSPTGPAPPE